MNKFAVLGAVTIIAALCFAELGDCGRPGAGNSGPSIRPGGGDGDRPCTSTSDCRFGVCDTTNNVCVTCLDDGDCPRAPNTCVNNQCAQCVANSDCTRGDANTCDNGRCVGCIGDSDCTNEFCFLGGKCMPQLSAGATCITNAWCSSETCTANVCA